MSMTYATTTLTSTRTSAAFGFWVKGLLIVGLLVAQAACGTAPLCETKLEAKQMCGADDVPSAAQQAECLAWQDLAGTDSCDAAVTDLYLCQIANSACVNEELRIYCSKERFECEIECSLRDCDILGRGW